MSLLGSLYLKYVDKVQFYNPRISKQISIHVRFSTIIRHKNISVEVSKASGSEFKEGDVSPHKSS